MIYLDYSANTPADPAVLEAFLRAEQTYIGNPNSNHPAGQAHFYVSDTPDSFSQTADLFLGEYKGGPVEQIAIDKY